MMIDSEEFKEYLAKVDPWSDAVTHYSKIIDDFTEKNTSQPKLPGVLRMKSFNEIELEIIHWAEARKIIPNSTPATQLLKMVSEVGELADSETKNDIFDIQDAVGDIIVCLINYCALRDISLLQCINIAFAEIKDRKGTLLPNGVFVKDKQ